MNNLAEIIAFIMEINILAKILAVKYSCLNYLIPEYQAEYEL